MIQSGVIEMGLFNHEIILFTRKMSLSKLNEHYEIPLRSMKNYSDRIFAEQLRVIKLPDYSNYNSVKGAYQDFATNFLSVIDFVAPIRTLKRVKLNTNH